MDKPVLVIMAAGMGSRYGGLKQIDPIDEQGHIIMDFSIYDAMEAGFEKVVFIIKKANEEAFKESIGNRMSEKIQVEYVYQELTKLPEGFTVPEGREKPFGTGHAILCCKDVLDGPFAVINADDYYGKHAYKTIYDYLVNHTDDEKYRYAMIGYALKNTLTENGHVARGVCRTDSEGFLAGIDERTHIEKKGDKAEYTEDDGQTWTEVSMDSTVSMNLWGFSKSILTELENGFVEFLKNELPGNPKKAEYFLPFAVDALLQEGKATVQVLTSQDKWYGVTYKEDKEMVVKAIAGLKEQGLYPEEF
ncbi:MAG: nucleotidyltransferase [Lachnospiraceae bacterium]|jgi:dTDP-glucose pyrophosphorylase|nr:nucleotidyltransferase [Lachnospiraceae bacterium]